MLNILRNIKLVGAAEREFLLDIYVEQNNQQKPIVIFTHGFKGFKDYGAWDLVAKQFAEAGFVFIKYNFSHNGTTVDDPLNFGDLEAFGNNNFSKELEDLGKVIDWVINGDVGFPIGELKRSEIYVIGHSRGGGTVMLKAQQDVRVKKVVGWASVADFDAYAMPGPTLAAWKKEGVHYIQNSRTKQDMPLYIQLYEDYIDNKDKLNIPDAAGKLTIPGLIVHGTDDSTVPFSVAEYLSSLNDQFKLVSIEKGDHVFGGKHPWEADTLPDDLKLVVGATVDFFKE